MNRNRFQITGKFISKNGLLDESDNNKFCANKLRKRFQKIKSFFKYEEKFLFFTAALLQFLRKEEMCKRCNFLFAKHRVWESIQGAK